MQPYASMARHSTDLPAPDCVGYFDPTGTIGNRDDCGCGLSHSTIFDVFFPRNMNKGCGWAVVEVMIAWHKGSTRRVEDCNRSKAFSFSYTPELKNQASEGCTRVS